MKAKPKYDLRKPCMGLFLQGGVKSLAAAEAGIEIAMLIIGTIAIVEMPNQAVNTAVDYAIYVFCYLYVIASIFLAQRLFVKASQRDRNSIWKIFLAFVILFVICFACLIYYTQADTWYPAILAVMIAYVLFKSYALWVIYSFISEIKVTEGINPALRDLTDGEVEGFFEGGGSPFLGDNYGDLPYKRSFEIEEGRIQVNQEY